MNKDAYTLARDQRALAAARLAGLVESLLSNGQIPPQHRVEAMTLCAQYDQAQSDMVDSLTAAMSVAA